MNTLALPRAEMRPRYDAVVVGSGYGGGIAACRLARAGLATCVIERGREIRPGEYPDTADAFLHELQVHVGGKRIGRATALFDMRLHKDINVVIGCGLGGTSLINAGIAIRPDAAIFAQAAWPQALRAGIEPRWFERAEQMLRPAPFPAGLPLPTRTQAVNSSATHLRAASHMAQLLVNFAPLELGLNAAGAEQQPCVHCGDCISGCNYGAKNTVLVNYLPDARNHGAQIFCEVHARRVERVSGGWRVYHATAGDDAMEGHVDAAIVVLAAGTLGSTEILLRSRQHGLGLSAQLGRRFSGNGDMLGFSYNGDAPVGAVGLGKRRPDAQNRVGPCSTVVIRHAGVAPGEAVTLADGVLPGALAPFLPKAFAAGARLLGSDTDRGFLDRVRERARELQSKVFGAYTGAIRNTAFFLAIASDDSGGVITLESDDVSIRWPGAGDQPGIQRAHRAVREAVTALGGTYIPNPVWNRWTDQNLISGHPLGGCAMADRAEDGVVDDRGRVFTGASGTTVHEGLFVLDGAIVPTSLGVNPLMTICALAERGVDRIVT